MQSYEISFSPLFVKARHLATMAAERKGAHTINREHYVCGFLMATLADDTECVDAGEMARLEAAIQEVMPNASRSECEVPNPPSKPQNEDEFSIDEWMERALYHADEQGIVRADTAFRLLWDMQAQTPISEEEPDPVPYSDFLEPLRDANGNEIDPVFMEADEWEQVSATNQIKAIREKKETGNAVQPPATYKAVRYTLESCAKEVQRVGDALRRDVVGQEHAIDEVTNALFGANMHASTGENVRAVFTFAGPAGVGKTFLAKRLAYHLYRPYLRVDFSMYASSQSYEDLVGFARTYHDSRAGELTSFVKQHPNAVLLFDEVDKANVQTLNAVLLRILEDGVLKDLFTRDEISFRNTLIIMTTNAGATFCEGLAPGQIKNTNLQTLRNAMASARDGDNTPALSAPLLSRMFGNTVVLFDWLTPQQLAQLAQRELEREMRHMNLHSVKWDKTVARAVVYACGQCDARTVCGQAKKLARDVASVMGRNRLSMQDTSVVVDKTDAPSEVKRLFKDSIPHGMSLLTLNRSTLTYQLDVQDASVVIGNLALRRTTLLQDRAFEVDTPHIKLADIVGMQDVKEECMQLINQQAPMCSVLLTGKPGVGKTMLAKALAGETGLPFLYMNATQFVQRYAGSGAENMRKLFNCAKGFGRAIVFIDEIDAIARQRYEGGGIDAANEAMLALLTNLDGIDVDENAQLTIVTATNCEDVSARFDPALLRRFDAVLHVARPGVAQRCEYIDKRCVQELGVAFDFQALATLTIISADGTLADINKAALAAQRAKKPAESLTSEAIIEAYEAAKYGKRVEVTKAEQEASAVHEAAHTVVAFLEGLCPSVASAVARARVGGRTCIPALHANTAETLLSELRIALAGSVGEVLRYGRMRGLSLGVKDDLVKARKLAGQLVELGIFQDRGHVFECDATYAQCVRELIDMAEKEVTCTLQLHCDKLMLVTEALMEFDRLCEWEIKQLLSDSEKCDCNRDEQQKEG